MPRWVPGLVILACLFSVPASGGQGQAAAAAPQGIRLENLTWLEAEKILSPDTIVVIPIGAAAKEHGPHLKLRNDFTLAEYLTRRVLEQTNVVVAPTLTYHFYPSFLEYPGSTSLTLETARDMTVDVVRTLAAYGPRRFYALNTGVSTVRALRPAAERLAADGILFRYTDLGVVLTPIERQVAQQPGGTHADEIETSMMLYIDPASVDMTKAAKDYDATGKGPLSRTRKPDTVYSPTGIFGDATLATLDKGRSVVEAFVPALVREIEDTRAAPLPVARPAGPPVAPAPVPSPAAPASTPAAPAGLAGTPQDERAIRELGMTLQSAWNNLDAWGVAQLWTEDGEVVHEDGFVEHTRQDILQERAQMFASREYRGSRHSLRIGPVRFLARDLALATGEWELRLVNYTRSGAMPLVDGTCTLVLQRTPEGWRFVSFRYEHQVRGEPVLTHAPVAGR
jgi:creatinine amidohydrolase